MSCQLSAVSHQLEPGPPPPVVLWNHWVAGNLGINLWAAMTCSENLDSEGLTTEASRHGGDFFLFPRWLCASVVNRLDRTPQTIPSQRSAWAARRQPVCLALLGLERSGLSVGLLLFPGFFDLALNIEAPIGF